MRVLVVTSKNYLWATRPFAYLFNIFWSSLQPVVLLTDVRPQFDLPSNFSILSPSNNRPVAKERWSDLLIVALKNHISDSQFVLMLEDYWLVRTVDYRGVETLAEYMRHNGNIARIDLTADRQFNGGAEPVGHYGHYDLVETKAPSDYQLSLQAGIWSRDHLISILKPGWSAWQTELEGTTVLNNHPEMRVLGTRQHPVRYVNALKGGDAKHLREEEVKWMPADHMRFIERAGWLPTKS